MNINGVPICALVDVHAAEVAVTFGRDSFECHGDSLQTPGGASHGCIIFAPFIRLQVVNAEPDRKLKVVAEESDVFSV